MYKCGMRVYKEYWTFSNLNNDNDFSLNEQFFSLLQKIENHPKCFFGLQQANLCRNIKHFSD